jgi:hypothetical protein
MRLMMLVATDPEGEPYSAAEDNIEEWGSEVDERGVGIDGDRLRPLDDAVTVRLRGGSLLVTNGPFTQSKEAIVGYDILEYSNLDEAVEIASKHPMAKFGRLELRPIWPLD